MMSVWLLSYVFIRTFADDFDLEDGTWSDCGGTVEKMDFGFSDCEIEFGPFLTNMNLSDFIEGMDYNNTDCKYIGFTKHPTMAMGHFIKQYDYDCQSPASLSWPLYLMRKESYSETLPTWYDVNAGYNFHQSGNSYNDAANFCTSKNSRLCTFAEYCPYGEFGELFDANIPEYFDAYAPYYDPNTDNTNNWLSLGMRNLDHLEDEDPYRNRSCWVHTWGKPWGLENTDEETTSLRDGKPGVCCAQIIDRGFLVVPGYVYDVVPVVEAQWRLSFDVRYNKTLHPVSNGDFDGSLIQIGDEKMLNVEVRDGNLFFNDNSGSLNVKTDSIDISMSGWVSVELSQTKMIDGLYHQKLSMNDEIIYSGVNYNPSILTDVSVYASGPGRRHSNSRVDNLIMTSWSDNFDILENSEKQIGGCKSGATDNDDNPTMLCKKKCTIKNIGREKKIKFKMLSTTDQNVMGQITVMTKSVVPYIGIIRLDESFCSAALLEEIAVNGNVRFDVGDKTDPNYWLESISYVRDVGESAAKRALFIQYRRGKKIKGEMMAGKKDIVFISINSFGTGFSSEGMEQCLSKAYLSVIKNDRALAYENDYTRCAAFTRYGLKAMSWSEKAFWPQTGISESGPDSHIGGCKDFATFGRENADMVCKTECSVYSYGKARNLDFQWIVESANNLVAQISVGYPGSLKGLVRFNAKTCKNSLLNEILQQGAVRFDITNTAMSKDRLVSLDSLTLPQNVGEAENKRSLFAQYRRTLDGEASTLLLIFTTYAPEKFRQMGITQDTLKECLQEAEISVITDALDDALVTDNDYTRCAAYTHYNLPINWNETHFQSTFPTMITTTTNHRIPNGVKCNGNVVSNLATLLQSDSKIVNGVEVMPHSWPFIARMKFGGFPGCAGSILNNHWILTAAHCCDGSSPSRLTFLVGDHQYSVNEGNEQEVQALEIFIHPYYDEYDYDYYYYDDNYDEYAYNHDVCLVRTEYIRLGEDVKSDVVCLPDQGQHILANDDSGMGPNCYVGGWGSTQEWRDPSEFDNMNRKNAKAQSDTLQSANVQIYSTEYCEEHTTLGGRFDPKTEFCAGLMEGGIDSCQGDSGGPLICINKQNEPVLYGVVSWGYGCARPNKPGIYAKVAPFIDWIVEVIESEGNSTIA